MNSEGLKSDLFENDEIGEIKFIEFLGGGLNNRLSIVEVDGRNAVVKEYGEAIGGEHDRYRHEMSFYNWLEAIGEKAVPRRIAANDEERAALFSWIEGESVSTADENEYATRFIEFLERLNQKHSERDRLTINAAEACFHVCDHFGLIEERVERLALDSKSASSRREFSIFIEKEVLPAWHHLSDHYKDRLGESVGGKICPKPCRWISPSDIGWHNTLKKNSGELVFFDFEYGGWDDPAKTLADLFEHPDRPIDSSFQSGFLETAEQLTGDAGLADRFRVIRVLYRFKWLLIVLNDCSPERVARRVYALGADLAEDRFYSQLRKARSILSTFN